MKASEYNKKLPAFLHRTDKQLQAEQDRQAALKPSTFTYNEDNVLFNRALVDERAATEALGLQKDAESIAFNRLKLAEAQLELGKFDEAYKTHPDKRYSQWLKKIRDAGSEPCDCPKSKQYNEQRGAERNIIELPNYRLWRMVYNGSPSQYISIFVCNICKSVWKDHS